MKLYTEDQMKRCFNDAQMQWANYRFMYQDFEECLIACNPVPIKLPSIEEIEKGMQKRLFVSPNPEHKMFNSGTKAGFINGAKWVLEQIKQQSK